jgi:hypothetical protein
MGKKIATLVIIMVAAILFGTTVAYLAFPPEKNVAPGSTTQTEAVKISKPIDLAGKWESAESKIGTKMVAEVKNNTIHIQMYVSDGYTGLWYGTFDILQPGQNTVVSKFIDDPDHFVLSSAETKDFLYQKGSLIFSYTVMGTMTTIELKRV